MAAIAGFHAQLFVTSVPSLALTSDVLVDAGDHKTFTESVATHVLWDKATPFVVQTSPDGTTWATVTSGFTINYPIGQVLFAAVVAGATPGCRILSGAYYPFSFLANAKSVDITPAMDIVDVTTFTNPATAWKQKIGLLIGCTVKIGKYFVDNQMAGLITNTTLLLITVYTGANTNQRYAGYVRSKQASLKFAVNAAETDDLDFEVDGQLYYVQS